MLGSHVGKPKTELSKGSSINDVTVLGGRGYKGFCDDGGRGCQKLSKIA